MPNASYCRFHNTSNDLADCLAHLDGELSDEEHKARKRLVRTCAQVLMSAGVEIKEFDLKDALDEVDGWQ